jgi:hypothetical protein
VERNGKAISRPIERVNVYTFKTAIREAVSKVSTIITDEWPSYRGIGREFRGGHKVVNHGIREYVRGDISTNTTESFFALLKLGVHGSFHHISQQYLSRYCDEFSFRWDNRKTGDGERAALAIQGADGKRLVYN